MNVENFAGVLIIEEEGSCWGIDVHLFHVGNTKKLVDPFIVSIDLGQFIYPNEEGYVLCRWRGDFF